MKKKKRNKNKYVLSLESTSVADSDEDGTRIGNTNSFNTVCFQESNENAMSRALNTSLNPPFPPPPPPPPPPSPFFIVDSALTNSWQECKACLCQLSVKGQLTPGMSSFHAALNTSSVNNIPINKVTILQSLLLILMVVLFFANFHAMKSVLSHSSLNFAIARNPRNPRNLMFSAHYANPRIPRNPAQFPRNPVIFSQIVWLIVGNWRLITKFFFLWNIPESKFWQ